MHELETRLWEVVDRDGRYRLEAYLFLLTALELAAQRLRREGHVSGQELLLAVRDLARSRFGQLAPTVFRGWGLEGSVDFGHIVMNLVDAGILSVRPEETIETFADVFDFERDFKGLGPMRPQHP